MRATISSKQILVRMCGLFHLSSHCTIYAHGRAGETGIRTHRPVTNYSARDPKSRSPQREA